MRPEDGAGWGYLDGAFNSLLVALIIFPPFALGAVHPWPAAACEVLAFLLVIVWALRINLAPEAWCGPSFWRPPLAILTILLAAFFIFQLTPLPPQVIRAFSPSTYNFYVRSFDGWPQKAPYSDLKLSGDKPPPAIDPSWQELPSISSARRGAATPFAPKIGKGQSGSPPVTSLSMQDRHARSADDTLSRFWLPPTWYPLSLSPELSLAAFIRFAAYAGLFFAVLAYPFADHDEGEQRFRRLAFSTIIISGLLVALTGLLERVWWNGKILWIFVPWDWGVPMPNTLPRASGPFVNPDHFGNYLAMIFPLTLTVALQGFPLVRRFSGAFRLVAGVTSFASLVAIMLSFSRAAWIEAALAFFIVVLLWVRGLKTGLSEPEARDLRRHLARRPHGENSGLGQRREAAFKKLIPSGKAYALATALIATLLVVMPLLYVVGPRGRLDAGERVADAVIDRGGIGLRPAVWKATLRMFADFPVVGAGLATWPEIYPHYAPPPWNPYFFREAHNDYLQYLSETGLLGTGVLAAFVAFACAGFSRSLKDIDEAWRPVLVALLLAMGGMAFHESIDFCLHIPANALLFTLYFALAFRIGLQAGHEKRAVSRCGCPSVRAVAFAMIGGSAILIVLALRQQGFAYPYDIEKAKTPERASGIVMEHPASSAGHLALLAAGGQNLPLAMRQKEIAIAVWLDPTNPKIHDRSARMQVEAGRPSRALAEMTLSVFNSPALETHYYLDSRVIPWLLPPEQEAIQRGFEEAITAGYGGAADNLAYFCDELGEFSEEAQVYMRAASDAHKGLPSAHYLIGAAHAEIKQREIKAAEDLLWQAIQAAPSLTDPYAELVTTIYGPAKQFSTAKFTADRGMMNGANPAQLALALSSAAEAAGNQAIAEKSLLQAIHYDPSAAMLLRAGQFYLRYGKYDYAASMLVSASEADPSSASAFYLLGTAEEKGYQYPNADKAYARAAMLAPKEYRPAYVAFRQRMDGSKKDS